MIADSADEKEINLDFDLWPKQLEAMDCFANLWLYGGAAGGGKSHLERVADITWALDIPGLQIYLFRRNFQDLRTSYIEGPEGFQKMLGPLLHDPEDPELAEIVAKEIRFPMAPYYLHGEAFDENGKENKPLGYAQSKIYLCHCQHLKDVFKFGSFEFMVLNIAEAGEFEKFQINYLMSRVRIPEQFYERMPRKYLIPKKYWLNPKKEEWQFPRVTLTANPIGPGKDYLKKTFVDNREPNVPWRMEDEQGGWLAQFIPARLNDNPSLDPVQYASRLKGIGSKGYVDALLAGKWDVPIGAYFPQIDKDLHLIHPVELRKHWPRFVAYDHGTCGEADEFSVGWYCMVGDSFWARSSLSNRPILVQRGSVVCYRRWNGEGLPKMTAAKIADGILEREGSNETILFRVAGGDAAAETGHGKSIFAVFSEHGVNFRKADRRRLNGWGQVDYRLEGENGWPLSFWFMECEGDLDTIGNLQHNPLYPADCLQKKDHDGDRHRYALMTCPLAIPEREEKDPEFPSSDHSAPVQKIVARISQKEKRKYVTKR